MPPLRPDARQTLVFELSKVEHVHVREAMVGHLRHIEEDLASRVAAGLSFDKMPDAPVAAAPVQELEPSHALQIIGKMKDTLMGRAIGILIADGSDGAVIKRIKKASTDAGATVKIVAPKVGGAKLADGSMLPADGQLAGTPSVLFDAVAVILSDEGAKALSVESAAIDFVRDAFGHLKAIAADKGEGCTAAVDAMIFQAQYFEDGAIEGATDMEVGAGRRDADADTALLVTHYDDCAEGKAASAFYDLCDARDLDDTLFESVLDFEILLFVFSVICHVYLH